MAKKFEQNDDVTHAPESGEPTEASSRAKEDKPQGKPVKPVKPSEPKIGEDRESGVTDPD